MPYSFDKSFQHQLAPVKYTYGFTEDKIQWWACLSREEKKSACRLHGINCSINEKRDPNFQLASHC